MIVRFYDPDWIALASEWCSPSLREAIYTLSGRTLDLSQAVKSIQSAAPQLVVCALPGFIAVRRRANGVPRPLIHFEGSEDVADVFRPYEHA